MVFKAYTKVQTEKETGGQGQVEWWAGNREGEGAHWAAGRQAANFYHLTSVIHA